MKKLTNLTVKTLVATVIVLSLTISCKQQKTDISHENCCARETPQTLFWKGLQLLEGKAFEGEIVSAPANDTLFSGKRLVMHVRSCTANTITIPFFVGTDSSRTWVFTLLSHSIQLKHDHRHSDGTPEELTMYGGKTTNSGSETLQIFPADQQTVDMLPGAVTNVWWIDFEPGVHYTYNLRRVNTDRLFSVRFDLSKEIDVPGKPWGWKDDI